MMTFWQDWTGVSDGTGVETLPSARKQMVHHGRTSPLESGGEHNDRQGGSSMTADPHLVSLRAMDNATEAE